MARDPKATWTLAITAPNPEFLHFRAWSATREEDWSLPIHSKQIEQILGSLFWRDSSSQLYGEGRALGTQLLPAALRSRLEQAADDSFVRVGVDVTTARLPWEVVIGNASDRVRPLRVARTVLGVAAPSKRLRAERRALVIVAPEFNNPVLPKLPGSVEEGKAVRQILFDHGFEVRLDSMDAAANILNDFYGLDHRVMLVSAHGVRDAKLPSGKIATGIVLGDGAYLTANDFDQLRVPPDFVFFNAPHLGEVPPAVGPASQLEGFIPARLLQKGVRTIVVPGMSMDDQEAFLFSKDLFAALVDGTHTVGTAMHAARLASLERQPTRYWWGAYHLYGETDYSIGDT